MFYLLFHFLLNKINLLLKSHHFLLNNLNGFNQGPVFGQDEDRQLVMSIYLSRYTKAGWYTVLVLDPGVRTIKTPKNIMNILQ